MIFEKRPSCIVALAATALLFIAALLLIGKGNHSNRKPAVHSISILNIVGSDEYFVAESQNTYAVAGTLNVPRFFSSYIFDPISGSTQALADMSFPLGLAVKQSPDTIITYGYEQHDELGAGMINWDASKNKWELTAYSSTKHGSTLFNPVYSWFKDNNITGDFVFPVSAAYDRNTKKVHLAWVYQERLPLPKRSSVVFYFTHQTGDINTTFSEKSLSDFALLGRGESPCIIMSKDGPVVFFVETWNLGKKPGEDTEDKAPPVLVRRASIKGEWQPRQAVMPLDAETFSHYVDAVSTDKAIYVLLISYNFSWGKPEEIPAVKDVKLLKLADDKIMAVYELPTVESKAYTQPKLKVNRNGLEILYGIGENKVREKDVLTYSRLEELRTR